MGERPATEDPNGLQAQGYFVADLTLAYRWRFVEVGLVVENLFNSHWREAQLANESYVAGRDGPRPPPKPDGTPSGFSDIHFTPGNPLNVRGTLAFYF